MPHGYVYVLPTCDLRLWVGRCAYTYFAGFLYHCSFYYDGLWSASKSGMSDGVALRTFLL